MTEIVSNDNPAIRVILVDDHHLIRAGLSSLIEHMERVVVVGEAATGEQGLNLVEQEKPDIAILDINLPGINGLECCARITRDFPGVHVLILSMHSTSSFVMQAIQVGAMGYLLKDSAQSELQVALLALADNQSYFSPAVSTHLLDAVRQHENHESVPCGENPFDKLTPRQREVVNFLVEGCNTKEIAFKLQLSTKTVESHRLQIQQRLNIHDIATLTRLAIKWNQANANPMLDFS